MLVDRSLKLLPKNGGALAGGLSGFYYRLGNVYLLDLNRYEEAGALYRQAGEINDQVNILLHVALGIICRLLR
ncbi:MAG: hypothetical protein GFH27_549305n109 [Chloroflexi bacterium AL-W]|nr:hypothetical protein [Chloroflexi bacterium AL-N1]NOK69355.1 hypothetical protein [Chloroflexi bacterium AL-N10]NOK76416.1 hypothetical protein [Chloroflexi bacterium AL-N5]NOK83533.1 hypothetical protein [Chloroflexi bacterium AL-W]NOK91193.1 hypothetical protein [Chloroflexi bacterium AL-N15]